MAKRKHRRLIDLHLGILTEFAERSRMRITDDFCGLTIIEPRKPLRASLSPAALETARRDAAEYMRAYRQRRPKAKRRNPLHNSSAIYGHFRNKADLLVEAINTSTIKSLDNMPTMPGTEAPNTLRIPISLVRCSAVKVTSPNKPRQEMNMAKKAK